VLPTPGVAFLTAEASADLGVVLSASHNPMPDTGIKLFAAGGHKLAEEIEDRIEAGLGEPWSRPVGDRIGRVHDLLDGADHYMKHLVAATPHRLEGLKVVVDCANGSASEVVDAYSRAGAEAVDGEDDGAQGLTHHEVPVGRASRPARTGQETRPTVIHVSLRA
jgi:phosphoglucosamine mutase